ncbi:PP2C family protein-serine/threonine phosphatase [Herbidospora yilanensis]|uniref:PP2C family protein-serine/threonine phosphatase n=1 Tax=Herbidospora yilanensis TaxID=354426 RepID=UPI0009FFC73D|nr:GAF domain-containing SpoIIE family protein phosphatase [Herbidospora yilanensis]
MAEKAEDPQQASFLGARLRLGAELNRIAEQLSSLARAQDRLNDMYEAVLSRNMDLSVVLGLIVSTATNLVGARYGALGVLDETGERLGLFVPMGLSEKERADLAGTPLPRGRGLLGHLISNPRPLRVDAIDAHPESAGFPPGHPPMRTLLGAPIIIRGEIFGNLYVSERLDGRPFDVHDESLIVALAGAAGLAIDDARLYEENRRDAERFQRLLLPRLPDHVEPFSVAAAYRPACAPSRVGGDWYDLMPAPGQACAAIIGDVVGHDLQAAAAMTQIRNMLRALLYDHRTSPRAVLTRLDRTVHAITDSPVTTACLARIEPACEGWTLRWSTAGHLPPLLLVPGRPPGFPHVRPDLPLGVDVARPRHNHSRVLPPGTTVIFFTDGLVEHRGHSIDDGMDRLAALAADAAALPVHDLVTALIDGHPGDGQDDMAILAIRTPPN